MSKLKLIVNNDIYGPNHYSNTAPLAAGSADFSVHSSNPREGERTYSVQASALETGGGGGHSGGMEARVAVLEQIARTTEVTLKEIKDGQSSLRASQERDFRIVWGGIITAALGLAALMAKGFHWI